MFVLQPSIPLVALLLSFASPAEPADHVRYDRPTTKVKPKTTLQTRFDAAKQAATRTKAGPADAAPLQRDREATSQAVLDEQITTLERLIRTSDKTDPELPDLLFRLADLQLDKRAFFDRQAGALYEPIHAAEQGRKTSPSAAQGELERLRAKQRRFEASAKAASTRAVEVYQALARTSSGYKRLDEALYYLAAELGALGREAEMKDVYLRLIRDFATSKYVANAYLAFGDFYYAKGEIGDALKLYQRIVDGYPDHPAYAYALYKTAWCHLNPVGTAPPEYTRSLDEFVATIAATLAGKAGSEANAKQLRRDARRDLVKAYLHVAKPSRAWEFFGKVGRGPKPEEDAQRSMMEQLAVAYFAEGKYVDSSAIYHTLQRELPDDPQVCHWQAQVVVNALGTDDAEVQWIESERLAAAWERTKGRELPEPVKRACASATRDTLRQMATVWHDEADKTRKPATYALADRAYRAFLAAFPDHPDAYEVGYFHAELLWVDAVRLAAQGTKASLAAAQARFGEAHTAFNATLLRKPGGRFTREAAYAQMLAMKNHLAYDETGSAGTGCRMNTEGVCVFRGPRTARPTTTEADGRIDLAARFPESDYTADEARMLAAYDTYEKYVKRGPESKDELPKILYHRVKLMMTHNRLAEAKPLAIDLLTRFDGTIYAAWASEMLVDILTLRWADAANDDAKRRSARDELAKWAKRLPELAVWKHPEADRVREQVPTLVAAVRGQQAEEFRLAGVAGDRQGFRRCAEEYQSIFNDHPEHDRADVLLFNAARCFEAAKLVGRAIAMRKELVGRYPKSALFKQTLRELGEGYHAIAFYGDAAAHYERYAETFDADAFAPEALQNAYLFRLGRGEQDDAARDLDRYEEIYKKKDAGQAARISWSKHGLLADDAARLEHARDYLAEYGSKGGVDRAVVAEATIGQILWRRSCSQSLLHDSCIAITRRKATTGARTADRATRLRARIRGGKAPKYCGGESQAIITVHARDPKLVGEAAEHFARALKLSAKAPAPPEDDVARAEAYRNAVGMAMVYDADRRYEAYLALEIPNELYFGAAEHAWKQERGPRLAKQYADAVAREKASRAAFGSYLERKLELGRSLSDAYGKVMGSGSKHWTLAAAARTALVHRNFADQLYRAPIPAELRTQDQQDVYCTALAERADPLVATADESLRYCLSRSTEFAFFNEFSRMCEEELQQTHAETFPATNEIFGRSEYTEIRMERHGVQTRIE